MTKKELANKMQNLIDASALRVELFDLSPRQYYKIRFTNTLLGEKGKECELFLKYKTLYRAEQAAKSTCKGEAYKDVRIVYILEYATEVKRIK